MFCLAFFLCFLIASWFSLATHPFDRLREEGLYPATKYGDRLPYFKGPYWVGMPPNDLQPVPQFTHSETLSAAHTIDTDKETEIFCRRHSPKVFIPDCKAAINIMPTGHLILDPRQPETLRSHDHANSVRFNLHLPRPLPQFRLPAAFVAGGCAVRVEALQPPYLEGPPKRYNVAAFMYHTMWPKSRLLAEAILEQCQVYPGWGLAQDYEGHKTASHIIGNSVTLVSIGRDRDRRRLLKRFNIYE